MASGANHFDDLLRRAQTRIGSTIDGKWKLDALLGVGGMAAVYAGTHRNGKRGAVKILHTEEALDPSVKTRFLREGFVANKVGHSGIASVLDDDEAPDGSVYLVMELLEGESLETRCPPGKTMATGDVLAVVNQVLDVLVAAHENGIVHRDLKPSNLFLLPDGTVKVLDFGIARLREITQAESQRAPSTTLSMLGTPGFMPPEQARGRWEEVDERSDIWAVGATMFVLCTGKPMHADDVPLNEQLLAAMTEPCPPISKIAPDVPEIVAKIIDRALAFKPADRWPNAQSMQAAVREAYRALTGRALSFTGGRTTGMRISMTDIDPGLASAPTLSATPTPSENQLRASSSRAALVVDGREMRPANGKWVGIAMAGVAACVVLFLVVYALRSSTREVAAASPSASAPASAAPAISAAPLIEAQTAIAEPAVTAAPSATAVSPAPSFAASHSTTHGSGGKLAGSAIAKPAPSHGKSSPAPSAAPSSNDVDIFNRRR